MMGLRKQVPSRVASTSRGFSALESRSYAKCNVDAPHKLPILFLRGLHDIGSIESFEALFELMRPLYYTLYPSILTRCPDLRNSALPARLMPRRGLSSLKVLQGRFEMGSARY